MAVLSFPGSNGEKEIFTDLCFVFLQTASVLQGPGTDPEAVRQLHEALSASPPRPVTITLLNYRKASATGRRLEELRGGLSVHVAGLGWGYCL